MYRAFSWFLRWLRVKPTPHSGIPLERLGTDIWSAERFVRIGGALVPLRMVVIRSPDRRVLIYAPVRLDARTEQALSGVGPVAWIVVPNRHHGAFVDEYRGKYPQAEIVELWGTSPASSIADWSGWFDTLVVEPCVGFRERVGFHRPSRTLVLCDLAVNFSAASVIVRQLMRLAGTWGRFGPSRLHRWFILRNREAMGGFYGWAMSRPFVQISVAHGDVCRRDAREAFYQAFGGPR